MTASIPFQMMIMRLALAALLLVAGSAKLYRRADTRAAAVELGVPAALASPVAVGLPLAELALAATVAVTSTARVAAGAAALLGACFTVLVGRVLIRGGRPRCHCFGDLVRTRVGWGMFVLDAAMTIDSVVIAVRGPGAPLPAHGVVSRALLLLAALCVLGSTAASARGTIVDLHERCETLDLRLRTLEAAARLGLDGATPLGGPEAGVAAPPLHVTDLDGKELRLVPRADADLLLLFLEPNCGPCERLLAEAAEWRRTTEGRLDIWIIFGESPAEASHAARQHGLDHVYAQPGRRASTTYHIPGSPSGVLIDQAGVVAVPLIAGLGAVQDLLTRHAPAAELSRAV